MNKLHFPSVRLLTNSGDPDGPLVEAFNYFVERIQSYLDSDSNQNDNEQFQLLCDAAMEKMEVVQIVLDKTHNANEVFDRLNTGGQPLGVIDLVRNEIFQTVSADYEAAIELYDRHWRPFETRLEEAVSGVNSDQKHRLIDGFFFPYALTQNAQAKKNRLLNELRDIWQKLSSKDQITSGEDITNHMEIFRSPYFAMTRDIKPEKIGDPLWLALQRLSRVPIPGVTLPYFMNLIASVQSEKTDEGQAIQVCKIIESFFVRRGGRWPGTNRVTRGI